MKNKLFSNIFIAFFAISIFNLNAAEFNVIPKPNSIQNLNKGEFVLNAQTKIVYPAGKPDMKRNAEFLSDYLQAITGIKCAVSTTGASNAIVLKTGLKSANKEAYTFVSEKNKIIITGASEAGVFYGIQTLRKAAAGGNNIASVSIKDEPRFGYRGMHLDVARHFFPAEFIKKYIDILALHNLNTFHWHLTEDQGWRIEIKKYPKLTEIGSVRKETVIGRNSGKFDGKPYGGYYTQDEIREIVKYAQDRYITIIPEIDLPGHMLAALAAYPELGCTGGPYEVERTWGVFDDVLCPGKENTFTFIENVLTEVMQLFPSKYIHIGGDECPKTRWKECPLCQARAKSLGLKDDSKHEKEFYLQSYVTERVENFLNEHGRQIIGWDEILEGKLAPNATVMSWRGMEGGIEAPKMKLDVIMTPSSHMYFDHYQTADQANEPLAIGGFTPVERVYSFEPVPKSLTEVEKKYILGPQANLWTEYILTTKQVEYMILPRIAALSEVQWTKAANKNYNDFLMQRLPDLLKLYDLYGYNYAKHIFDVQPVVTPNTKTGKLDVSFSSFKNAPVYYTLDGTTPTDKSIRYTQPFGIDKPAQLKAVAILPDGKASKTFELNFQPNKATLKPITLLTNPHSNYSYAGATVLNDGLKGVGLNYKTGRWLGFQGNDLEAVIDLQIPTQISRAAIETLASTGDWILDAQSFSVAVSDDGKNFAFLAGMETNPTDRPEHHTQIYTHTITFQPVTTRYVKVTVKPFYQLPKWCKSQGRAFVFVDEITLE